MHTSTERDLLLIQDLAHKLSPVACPSQLQTQVGNIRCFTFRFGYPWQGVVFSDGYVCIRGKCVGRSALETHQYSSIDEMLEELLLNADDIEWQHG